MGSSETADFGTHPILLATGGAPLPLPESGWFYYAICAAVFVFAGLVCGYFIWRKGAMQAQDAELELQRSNSDIEKMRETLGREESILERGAPAESDSGDEGR